MKGYGLVLLAFLAGVGVGRIAHRSARPLHPFERLPPPSAPLAVLPPSVIGRLALFLLAGQSNMAGGTPVTTAAPVEGAWLFGNDYRWHRCGEPSDAGAGQVDLVSWDGPGGYSPASGFARALRRLMPGQPVGLIPCAKGGSGLQEWQRNRSDSSLYGSLIKRANATRSFGRLAGLLFYQGETDAFDPTRAPGRRLSAADWAPAFARFVDSVRADLDAPRLPVVFAQIGTNIDPERFTRWSAVQRSQAEVHLSGAAMIRTDDLPLAANRHLTPAACDVVGARMAAAGERLHR